MTSRPVSRLGRPTRTHRRRCHQQMAAKLFFLRIVRAYSITECMAGSTCRGFGNELSEGTSSPREANAAPDFERPL